MRLALILAASVIGTAAFAQDTTIIKRDSAPSSTTVIEKRDTPTVVEKRSVETTGSVGCSTTTERKSDALGDTTTKKTDC
ncbi:hypothetical protein [Salinarimonas soli]|uniref:Uncharacterized protein n=1 Tax=Salinarimonas soli TaxID=1638099 RepID=A0A5B2VF37_9HYPH|nr:hypothetical protein [Salinarimonas soli]KAA2237731.1 hypothetical protein F0L46_08625 [Salinarimonas soli]